MGIEMTPGRWRHTCDYLDTVFGDQDDHLAGLMERAVAAGLPDIAISASVGRMLMGLARMVEAKLIIEVGTLAGYSGIWLARGLAEGGKLITVEPNDLHAGFAESAFAEAGVGDRVDVVRGFGTPVLEQLASERAGGVDLVFLDAIKSEYPVYLPFAKALLRPGGLLVADNMLGGGDWWIDTPEGQSESRDAADRVNRLVAADPDFEAFCVPIREGVMVARRKP
ncbi:MAG: O-methyltransferase [Phycisphaerales bacterium]|nr:O-methyltransferase [Phycisphaerales bacterium]